MIKWLIGGAACAVAAACTSFSARGSGPSPAPAKSASVVFQNASVTELYKSNCSSCHGHKGEGGGAGSKTLLTAELFDQKHDRPFFDAIKNGVPDLGMAAFGKSLSDEQIWALVVKIREMQRDALREAGAGAKAVDGVYASRLHKYRVEDVVTSGLTTPWAIDWLPDGRMLVTSRSGSLSIVKDGAVAATVEGTPESVELGQGGLMDILVHPDWSRNGWIYLSYSEAARQDKSNAFTKIVRGKIAFSGSAAKWTSQQTIWEAPQDSYSRSGIHFGSRLVLDKGSLYFTVGERGSGDRAQDLAKPNGKVFRVREDGSIPEDNPFVKTPGALPEIWTYGHRNPQGLAMDLEGRLWDTEHGPRGGDEVNLIQKGGNYGWPLYSFAINYNDTPYTTPWPPAEKHMIQPVFRWLPSIGSCGLAVEKGPAFPGWKGDLFAGGLSGANLDRIRVKNGEFVEREEILWGLGRVRDVAVAKDGIIYVALNQPDKIIRIVPAD